MTNACLLLGFGLWLRSRHHARGLQPDPIHPSHAVTYRPCHPHRRTRRWSRRSAASARRRRAEIQIAEERARRRGDADDAGAGAARGVDVARGRSTFMPSPMPGPSVKGAARTERAVRLHLVAQHPLTRGEIEGARRATARCRSECRRACCARAPSRHAVLDQPDAVRHLLVGILRPSRMPKSLSVR